MFSFLLFFKASASTEIYTLSLHDALPISLIELIVATAILALLTTMALPLARHRSQKRSEEHTSELQSLRHLVCRLLLEKKKLCKDDKDDGIVSNLSRK